MDARIEGSLRVARKLLVECVFGQWPGGGVELLTSLRWDKLGVPKDKYDAALSCLIGRSGLSRSRGM